MKATRVARPLSGLSAATGKPHYFGRLYGDSAVCIFCGQPRDHEWHLNRVTG